MTSFLLAVALTAQPGDPVATAAREVLTKRCYACHGEGGAAKSNGMDYVLDAAKLIEKKKVVPNDPAKSLLLKRVKDPDADSRMPPDSDALPASDIAALEKWIAAGAKPFPPPPAATRPPVTEVDVYRAMHAHLSKQHPASAMYQRYITLANLHNDAANVDDAKLRLARAAVAKLLNSLSWKKKLVRPEVLPPQGVVMAVDVRDLDWDVRKGWQTIVGERPDAAKDEAYGGYPYGLRHDRYPEDEVLNRMAEQVYTLADTQVPAVRADWLLANASRPPLYHELLDIPRDLRDLQRRVKVDPQADFLRDRAVRVGITASGVSANANRLLEILDSAYGVHIESYDFRTNAARGNLATHPNGPLNLFAHGRHPFDDTAFVHDGGETIGSLPNGLHYYALSDGERRRINEGPADVVRDPKEFGGRGPIVVNGVSCMGCHAQGIIRDNAKDSVRSAEALQGPARDKMRRLYPDQKTIDKVLEDAQRDYLAALDRAIGSYLTAPGVAKPDLTQLADPITLFASPFLRNNVTLESAALDLGVPKEELKASIKANPKLGELGLGPLAAGGTIKRTDWESKSRGDSLFQAVAAELRRGGPINPTRP